MKTCFMKKSKKKCSIRLVLWFLFLMFSVPMINNNVQIQLFNYSMKMKFAAIVIINCSSYNNEISNRS